MTGPVAISKSVKFTQSFAEKIPAGIAKGCTVAEYYFPVAGQRVSGVLSGNGWTKGLCMLVKQLSSQYEITRDWKRPDQRVWVHGRVVGLLNPKCLTSPFDLSQHKIPIILGDHGGYLKDMGVPRPLPGSNSSFSSPDSAKRGRSNAAMAQERQEKRRRMLAGEDITGEALSSPSTGRERGNSPTSSPSTVLGEPAATPSTPTAQFTMGSTAVEEEVPVVRPSAQTRSSHKGQKTQQKL